MAFVKNNDQFQVGDTVRTKGKLVSFAGYFEPESIVKIIGVGDRGYDLEDSEGNRILECGWNCIERI